MTAIRVVWHDEILGWRIDVPPQTGSPYRGGYLYAPVEGDAVAAAVAIGQQLQLPAVVWDGSVAPGGFVCAHPDPTTDTGRCGMPVESEPCEAHTPAPKPLDPDATQLLPAVSDA